MTEYFNLSEWLRFRKMLNYQPTNAAFTPKRSTVIKNKQRRKREGGKK